ncbi:YfjI family protein [Bradyrhizobium sp. Mp27]|uniref:YfjI family protein n=1 Tax=Bradyrhizobium sp. Mp27 TaxID=3042157 RepID=UPI00248B1536|nr:YfjI family protein [Bradyrhizobium sp. Mp27]MDI2073043.1 YfjI family protein [Bradyrhizobium sp. Mp27]
MTESVTMLKGTIERPLPLVRQAQPAGSFPIEALGPVLGDAAAAIHEHVQSPLAMCGQAVLAAAALVVQGHADVELATGQIKPVSNFFLTVAASGEKKTATDQRALAPVRKHEEFLAETYKAERQAFLNDHAAWDAARKAAINSHKGDRSAIRNALNKLGPEPVAPPLPMLTCPDPTFEGLTLALQQGQPSMGVFSSEGGQFVGGHAMSEENKLASAAAFSSCWDGEPIKRVRAKDGVTVLPGRRLAMHLMVQPDVAHILLSDPVLIDQGMLSRYLMTAPEAQAGRRFHKEPSPESRVKLVEYERQMYTILQRQLPHANGNPHEVAPQVLRLTSEARTLLINFADHVEGQLGPDGELKPISGLGNKLPEHAARLAAVLTMFTDPDAKEIGLEAVERGIKLARHYADEALRLFEGAKIDAKLRQAGRLLGWLHQSWKEPNVSLPDIYQRGPNFIGSRKSALELVAVLEAHGWLRKLPGGALVAGEHRRNVWHIVRET